MRNLQFLPNIRVIKARRVKWAGHVASMGEMRKEYTILVRKPDEKRPLGRPTCSWEYNIKMVIRK
jgi:hypothetical protein